jgi:membrane protein DedA with SNARE-associated domain
MNRCDIDEIAAGIGGALTGLVLIVAYGYAGARGWLMTTGGYLIALLIVVGVIALAAAAACAWIGWRERGRRS